MAKDNIIIAIQKVNQETKGKDHSIQSNAKAIVGNLESLYRQIYPDEADYHYLQARLQKRIDIQTSGASSQVIVDFSKKKDRRDLIKRHAVPKKIHINDIAPAKKSYENYLNMTDVQIMAEFEEDVEQLRKFIKKTFNVKVHHRSNPKSVIKQLKTLIRQNAEN